MPKLPGLLHDYQDHFRKFLKPYVIFTIEKALKKLPETASKVVGVPYWPRTLSFPHGDLAFTLQLNFSEMPSLEGFPRKGILQLFTERECSLSGNVSKYALVYHSEFMKNEDLIQEPKEFPFRVGSSKEFEIRFDDQVRYQLPPEFDMSVEQNFHPEFDTLFDLIYFLNKLDPQRAYEDLWFDLSLPEIEQGFYQIGGYPHFIQQETRRPNDGFTELILQLDGIDNFFSFGDSGICRFFLSADDLKAKNFSKAVVSVDSA